MTSGTQSAGPQAGGVAIREATRSDIAEVSRFRDAFDSEVVAAWTAAFLDDPGHHLILAYVDGEPAGFVSATEVLHPDKPPQLFLNEIGVAAPHQRRGAATALIEALKVIGRKRGCTSMWVLTDEGNAAAMALYRMTGGSWDGAQTVMFEYELERPDEPTR